MCPPRKPETVKSAPLIVLKMKNKLRFEPQTRLRFILL
jgi:hypothetical protein